MTEYQKYNVTGKYLGEGKFNSEFEVNGAKDYFKKGKFFKGNLEIGLVYDLGVSQGVGMKTKYLDSAKLIGGNSLGLPGIMAPIAKPTSSKKEQVVAKKETTDPDKMSKLDWQKKDSDIKWMSVIKSSAEFHARRPESTIEDVICDAQKLFEAPSVCLSVEDDLVDIDHGTEPNPEELNENGGYNAADPYKGL